MGRELNEAAWNWTESAHVCMSLWEAGFCGPESAERGPIMMAAKEKAVEAFLAGAAWQRKQDAKLCDEHAAGYQALREHARDDVNDRLVHLCERDAAMTLAKEIRAGTSDDCRCSVSGENVVCHHGRVHNQQDNQEGRGE